MNSQDNNFWKSKTLDEMNVSEWESLCDNCGKCCLYKLEDEDTGEIYFTNVVCKLIDMETCRCSRYLERSSLVPDCLDLKAASFTQYHWLPPTCAYRLLAEGESLPDWHPLVSGRPESVQQAGRSVNGFAVIEDDSMDLADYVLEDFE